MQHGIEAIYENGAFRPLDRHVLAIGEGQRVRITVDNDGEPEPLRLAALVYDGLSVEDVDEIERIALTRGRFFGGKSST